MVSPCMSLAARDALSVMALIRSIRSTCVILLIVWAVVAATTFVPVARAASAELTFSPPSLVVDAGGRFNVDVVVTTDIATRGLQFGIAYDPALVQIDEVSDGSFYASWATAHGAQAATVIHFKPNNTTGHVSIGGMALFGASWDGPSGTGPVLHLAGTARPGASGTATLAFESPWVTSAQGAPIRPLSTGTAALGIGAPPAVQPRVDPVPTGRVHLPEAGISAEVDTTGLQSSPVDLFVAWIRTLFPFVPLAGVLAGLCGMVIVYRVIMSVPVRDDPTSPTSVPTRPDGGSDHR